MLSESFHLSGFGESNTDSSLEISYQRNICSEFLWDDGVVSDFETGDAGRWLIPTAISHACHRNKMCGCPDWNWPSRRDVNTTDSVEDTKDTRWLSSSFDYCKRHLQSC